MISYVKFAYIAAICWALCYLSIDIYMLNTGDFYRAIFPFLENIKQFSDEGSLIYQFREAFRSIGKYDYISSVSYVLYIYAVIVSSLTHFFDLRVWSAILKVLTVLSFYYLFNGVNKSKFTWILFPLALIWVVTPSNISQFSSFYQDQFIILLVPLVIAIMIRGLHSRADYIYLFIACTMIATSKSQYFYFPVLISACFIIFKRNYDVRLHLPMGVATVLAILCIVFSGTTKNNSFHSTYFGTYLYADINGIALPDNVDTDCIGIDSWGNKFNIEKGAERTTIRGKCFADHQDVSIGDSVRFFASHPLEIFKLPYDKGISTQLGEDYFHVYKNIRIVESNSTVLNSVMNAKESALKGLRFSILVIVAIISLLAFKWRYSMILFATSAFGISQFYISFLGEGYRDLNKHLIGMNYSVDILIFLAISLIVKIAFDKFAVKDNQ